MNITKRLRIFRHIYIPLLNITCKRKQQHSLDVIMRRVQETIFAAANVSNARLPAHSYITVARAPEFICTYAFGRVHARALGTGKMCIRVY